MELVEARARRTRLVAASAIALLVIIVVWGAPRRAPVVAPPDAISAPRQQLRGAAVPQPPASTAPAATLPPGAALVAGQLALYTTPGSYGQEQLVAMAPALAEALAYVEQRTGMHLAGPLAVTFERRETCGVDGAAYTERRTIVLYACPDLPARRAVNILAHEYVHQLAHDHFGDAHLRADLALSEGFATWGAGRYWLGEESTFRGFVQRYYADSLLPLGSHYRDYGTVDAMNRLYYQWAALVEYLQESRGAETFNRLYASGSGAQPQSADYVGVLGVDLAALEIEWKDWLAR